MRDDETKFYEVRQLMPCPPGIYAVFGEAPEHGNTSRLPVLAFAVATVLLKSNHGTRKDRDEVVGLAFGDGEPMGTHDMICELYPNFMGYVRDEDA